MKSEENFTEVYEAWLENLQESCYEHNMKAESYLFQNKVNNKCGIDEGNF